MPFNTEYKTKESAEEVRDKLAASTEPKFYCPLHMEQCDMRCWCSREPYVMGNSAYGAHPNTYRIYPWYCDNPMFIPREDQR